MSHDFKQIANQWFTKLQPTFNSIIGKRFALDDEAIDDIYADVWMDVYNNIQANRVTNDTNWKSYILTIGRNRAIKFISRNLGTEKINGEIAERYDFGAMETPGEHDYDRREEQYLRIEDAWNTLSSKEQSVLNMYYFQHKSMQEIAEAHNYSNARTAITVKNKCLNKLRRNATSPASFPTMDSDSIAALSANSIAAMAPGSMPSGVTGYPFC